MSFRIYTIENFPYGQIDSIEAKAIPDGAASAARNWHSMGDRIELRSGFRLLGTEIAGLGRISGLHTAFKNDGSAQLWATHGRTLKYFNEATQDWVEAGSSILPATVLDANGYGEDQSFANYASQAGTQMWINSPNGKLLKIMTANPDNPIDMTTANNFTGYIKISQNRMKLWHRPKDLSGIYGSYIDVGNEYTAPANQTIGTGDGATKSFAGTLTRNSVRHTLFGVSVSDGVETFTDDYQGSLIGSLGGSGIINYVTGAIAVTFKTAPLATVNVVATSQQEDPSVHGIADFSKTTPRLASQGFVFRQDDGGGEAMAMPSYGVVDYCMHKLKTWVLNIGADDTAATNLIYRENVGIPNWRAAVPTGFGIYYIDDTDQNDPHIRVLTLNQIGTEVLPFSISKRRQIEGTLVGVSLTGYVFDKACGIEIGDFIIFACRRKSSAYNDTVITYNKNTGALDFHDFYVSCFAKYNGKLIAGDSLSNNVYELFTGYDDDNTLIPNSWESGYTRQQIEELKKTKRLVVRGLIQQNQILNVYISVDNGAYTLAGVIDGSGDYVDRGTRVTVGSPIVGDDVIGGAGDGVDASPYERAIKLNLDKYYEIKVKFEATQIGYVSVNRYRWYDIRLKGNKIVKRYRL